MVSLTIEVDGAAVELQLVSECLGHSEERTHVMVVVYSFEIVVVSSTV